MRLCAALLLAVCALLATGAAAGAKTKPGYCAKVLKLSKLDAHHYVQEHVSGGVRFYRDKKFKNEFMACSDKTHTTSEGENLDNDPHFTVKRFVGTGGRCAIAVLENATAHTYGGAPVKNTIIAAFRLYSSNGLGFNVTATPGSGSFAVPVVRLTSTCYAGWVEVPPTPGANATLSVLDIGNAKRFADVDSSAFAFFTDGLTDPSAWTLAPAGRGATLSWTDANGANVKQIPAP
ncbi:MAG: hypothetical protein JWQ18_748 [Conexibacter sp.]|nr:hypothetical protein [Conexibacter sp.]